MSAHLPPNGKNPSRPTGFQRWLIPGMLILAILIIGVVTWSVVCTTPTPRTKPRRAWHELEYVVALALQPPIVATDPG
jgi:hypothetical protein